MGESLWRLGGFVQELPDKAEKDEVWVVKQVESSGDDVQGVGDNGVSGGEW